MSIEIERKFLLRDESWRPSSEGVLYRQGYLSVDAGRSVRIRIVGGQAWLTVKGKSKGMSRQEFEYEIPRQDAIHMVRYSDTYHVTHVIRMTYSIYTLLLHIRIHLSETGRKYIIQLLMFFILFAVTFWSAMSSALYVKSTPVGTTPWHPARQASAFPHNCFADFVCMRNNTRIVAMRGA
ncbi:MAG: hypothetical protein Q9M27_02980 [Mariprofundaceae bacterium]|nr:hypothetical protein [Mariprofundaceae bacterium]